MSYTQIKYFFGMELSRKKMKKEKINERMTSEGVKNKLAHRGSEWVKTS